MNTLMNLLVPYNVGKFLRTCATGSFSRRIQLHEVSYTECIENCWTLYFVAIKEALLPEANFMVAPCTRNITNVVHGVNPPHFMTSLPYFDVW
jgi:hypothetical protein